MTEQPNTEFDFDDWAGLYLENPEEFEARRKAALMIEMTRGTAEQCANGRAMLESYEKRVEGLDPAQRLQVAAEMMSESARALGTEFKILKQSLSDTDT